MDLINLPAITRAYLVLTLITSIAVRSNIISPYQLYFTFKAAFEQGQIWRAVTCFLYWGRMDLDFIFHIFYFLRYSKMIEDTIFHGRRADYAWLLIVSCSILLALSPLSPTPFLCSSLSFTLVYVWSRLNPSVRISIFGLFTVPASYLPYVLCMFPWAFAGGRHREGFKAFLSDFFGIIAGHFWYFFHEIWPRERSSGRRKWLETPKFLIFILDSPERVREIEELEKRRKEDAVAHARNRAEQLLRAHIDPEYVRSLMADQARSTAGTPSNAPNPNPINNPNNNNAVAAR